VKIEFSILGLNIGNGGFFFQGDYNPGLFTQSKSPELNKRRRPPARAPSREKKKKKNQTRQNDQVEKLLSFGPRSHFRHEDALVHRHTVAEMKGLDEI
jgi:hypothetical protein